MIGTLTLVSTNFASSSSSQEAKISQMFNPSQLARSNGSGLVTDGGYFNVKLKLFTSTEYSTCSGVDENDICKDIWGRVWSSHNGKNW